jgi:hypothetical protein
VGAFLLDVSVFFVYFPMIASFLTIFGKPPIETTEDYPNLNESQRKTNMLPVPHQLKEANYVV